jgi:hypothetical protein
MLNHCAEQTDGAGRQSATQENVWKEESVYSQPFL